MILSALLAVLSGCEKQEGPAERAGKEVDQAAQQTGEKIEEIGESIQDAAKSEEK